MNADFWRGRRVLVTGHTGFKGAWLSLWLQALGAEVAGLALAPPTTPNLFEVARVGEMMRSRTADVRDLDAVEQAIHDFQPEVVFHLAAQSLVRRAYANPVDTYATNVMGTLHVLEAVRRQRSTRAVVVVTSDKCYENRESVWPYREDEPMGGRDPYSSSKGCAELLTAAYRASFMPGTDARRGAAVATVRAGNVIGGGDWAEDRLVPDVLRAITSGQRLRLRKPDAIRPWQHVLEPLGGYLLLAERLCEQGSAYAEAWNFGPRDVDCRSVRSVVNELARAWRCELAVEEGVEDDLHEAHTLRLDSSKATSRLGWQPRWDLATALHSVVDWHQAHAARADMRAATAAQIDAYQRNGVDDDGARTDATTHVIPR